MKKTVSNSNMKPIPADREFIIWDPKDGPVPRSSDGEYNTSGCLGRLTGANVYLTTYAIQVGEKKIADLDVHERTTVEFRLSGEKGTYDVIRVA